MTNYEYLKNINIEQLSRFLCDQAEIEGSKSVPDGDICESCPMYGRCFEGHNGWLDWLKEEKK